MIDLILLAILFIALLFVFTTVTTETLVLMVLKWGNLWQALSIAILMNAISFVFLICSILQIGSINVSIFNVYSSQPESIESSVFSTTWNIQVFVNTVLIEGLILFVAGMMKPFKNLPKNEAMEDGQPIWWRSLLRAMFLSFCANLASFTMFAACKASSAFW